LAERIRQGRNYGKGEDGEFQFAGLSSRLSETHALIGLERLKSVAVFLKRRKAISDLYRENLRNIEGIKFQRTGKGPQSSENYFPVFIDEEIFGLSRDVLCDALKKENIETHKFFSPPCHRHRAFKKYCKGSLPCSEKAAMECLTLPLYPTLEEKKILKICEAIERIYEHGGEIKKKS
jgi:dTDP-4-amino-4,6-dideoxygalactose transaminase